MVAKIIKILVVLLFTYSSLKAQTSIGIGGSFYHTDTYMATPVGLSLQFTINKIYFDVSSNFGDKHFYQINKNISSLPVLDKIFLNYSFKYLKNNVCVANVGYIIKLPIYDSTISIIPIIGYGWSQLIYTPANYSYYQRSILFANVGILITAQCWKRTNFIFGVASEEKIKFGVLINLSKISKITKKEIVKEGNWFL